MQLSKRLELLYKQIDDRESVIDVAADHGLLSLKLAIQNPQRKIIISDIAEKPLLSGKENFAQYNLAGDFRLGNGLQVLELGEEVDVAVIAGVGGKLITEILADDMNKTQQVKKFVLSTNNGMVLVRQWADEHGYSISKTVDLEENGRFYENIVMKKALNYQSPYATGKQRRLIEFYYGHDIDQRLQDDATKQRITNTIEQLQFKLEQMKQAQTVEVITAQSHFEELVNGSKELLKNAKIN